MIGVFFLMGFGKINASIEGVVAIASIFLNIAQAITNSYNTHNMAEKIQIKDKELVKENNAQ